MIFFGADFLNRLTSLISNLLYSRGFNCCFAYLTLLLPVRTDIAVDMGCMHTSEFYKVNSNYDY